MTRIERLKQGLSRAGEFLKRQQAAILFYCTLAMATLFVVLSVWLIAVAFQFRHDFRNAVPWLFGFASMFHAALGVMLIRHAYHMYKESLKPRPNLCPVCGYDLRATPDRCPECGTEAKKDQPQITTASHK